MVARVQSTQHCVKRENGKQCTICSSVEKMYKKELLKIILNGREDKSASVSGAQTLVTWTLAT
jgi:hypothetical protein